MASAIFDFGFDTSSGENIEAFQVLLRVPNKPYDAFVLKLNLLSLVSWLF
jgi:hypothetical protein